MEIYMARTKRNKPHKKLDSQQQKFADRNKYKHGVHTKSNIYELEFTQSAKKEEKRLKHKRQRKDNKERIQEQTLEQ